MNMLHIISILLYLPFISTTLILIAISGKANPAVMMSFALSQEAAVPIARTTNDGIFIREFYNIYNIYNI